MYRSYIRRFNRRDISCDLSAKQAAIKQFRIDRGMLPKPDEKMDVDEKEVKAEPQEDLEATPDSE